MLAHSFLAGFLHDIGKLILVSSLTDQYIEATELAQATQRTIRLINTFLIDLDKIIILTGHRPICYSYRALDGLCVR